MTPEEKSKELVEKFQGYCGDYRSGEKSSAENAKQCAFICVDEIIELMKLFKPVYDPMTNNLEYWQSVREAITKM